MSTGLPDTLESRRRHLADSETLPWSGRQLAWALYECARNPLRICIIGLAVANVMLVTITPTSAFLVDVDPSMAAGGLYPRAADKAFFFTMSLVGFFVTGGLVSSRAMLARLAPKEILNEMFGLYALSGTATSFLGPLTIAILTQVFRNQRVGLAAGVVFLLAGMALLNRVNEWSIKR